MVRGIKSCLPAGMRSLLSNKGSAGSARMKVSLIRRCNRQWKRPPGFAGMSPEAFRALARFKLDGLMQEKVISGIDATERRALALIKNHREALEELSHKRDEAQRHLDEAEAGKHKCDQDSCSTPRSIGQAPPPGRGLLESRTRVAGR